MNTFQHTPPPAVTAVRLCIEPCSGVKVILFDLWKTLARGPYPEPIVDLMQILRLDGKVDKEEFLRFCLTTPHEDPRVYLRAVAGRFQVPEITEDQFVQFETLVKTEQSNLLWYTEVSIEKLQALKAQGYRLGLVTNSWPFPVRKFLYETKLGEVFEHVIISAEVGFAKQDGPVIYQIAAQYFGVRPEECLVVGDNPLLDTLPPVGAGAQAVLLDRYYEHVSIQGQWKNQNLSHLGVPVIRSLDELWTPQQ